MLQDYKKPFYHFSIDDVIDSLIQVSDSSSDLFSNYFFQFLEMIHNKYDVKIDLYCFYQKNIQNKLRNLTEVSDQNKNIFINNPWLRLGPHALDYDSPPYAQSPDQQIDIFDSIYDEIERFTGNPLTCEFLRLHFFTESYELSDYFRTKNIHSLFTTDKPDIAYRLDDDMKSILDSNGHVEFNKINFIRSHFRIETLVNENYSDSEICKLIENCLSKNSFVTFLTHERELVRPKVRTTIELILMYLKDNKVMSV
jgi:hypothetical protein